MRQVKQARSVRWLSIAAVLGIGIGCSASDTKDTTDAATGTAGSAGSAGTGGSLDAGTDVDNPLDAAAGQAGSSGNGGSGGSDGGAAGNGGSGGASDCDTQHSLTVSTSYGDVAHCGQFAVPMNSDSEASSLQIFSDTKETITIKNPGANAVVLNSVVLTPRGDGVAEEFQIREDSLKGPPLTIKDVSIPAGGSYSFQVLFFPVAGGERFADAVLTYDGTKAYRLAFKGRGHPKTAPDTAVLSTHASVAYHKLFGGFGSSQDEQPSGIAADGSGNVFFAGASKDLTLKSQGGAKLDSFYYDLIYGKLNPDGSLAWYKIWGTSAKDYMPDSGENDQSGSPKSVVVDPSGNPYVIGAVGIGEKAQNVFATLVMKLNPTTGTPVWENFWHPQWDRVLNNSYTDSATPYAVDYNDGRIYVAGHYSTVNDGGSVPDSDSGLFVIALDAATGALLWNKHIDPAPKDKSNDRGYAIRAFGKAGSETVYVGGWTGATGVNNTFLAKLSWDSSVNDYWLTWKKIYEYHVGARINGLDVDADGDVYVSIDNADYSASFMRVAGSDGHVVWAKAFADIGTGSPEVTTDAVRVVGDDVYFGGIYQVYAYDTQGGDAWVAKLSKQDGSLRFANFYFSGKSPENLCSHQVKGIDIVGNSLYLGGSVYTGNANNYRYWGYWYEGTRGLVDLTVKVLPATGTVWENIATSRVKTLAELKALTGNPATKVANIRNRFYGEQITDYPGNANGIRTIEFQNAPDKTEATHASQVDKDLMFWKLDLK